MIVDTLFYRPKDIDFYFICMAARQCRASLQSEVCQQINFSVKRSIPEQQLPSLFLIVHSVWHYDYPVGAGGGGQVSWLLFRSLNGIWVTGLFHGVCSGIWVCRRQRKTSWCVRRHGFRQRCRAPERTALDQGKRIGRPKALCLASGPRWQPPILR